MKSNKRLTPQEFEALSPYLDRLGANNVVGARAIMVDGRKQAEVAREMGVSKGAISAVVCRIWESHLEHGSRPKGWVSLNVTLPPDLADVVVDMARKAREKETARLPSPDDKAGV